MYCYLESTKNSENSKKMNKSAEKWAKDLNRHFIEETPVLSSHMQECSNSSGIKETQIKI